MKVPTYVALRADLMRVEPEPVKPSGTITNADLVDDRDAWRAWGRGLAEQLRKIAELQPKGAVP